MQTTDIPNDLVKLRENIDSLDEEIVSILVKRYKVTAAVGQLKAKHNLSSVDSVREKEKLTHLELLAKENDLNSEHVLELFQLIFAEVVKNHRSYKN